MTTRKRDILIFSTISLGSAIFLLWVIPAFTPPYPGYGVSSALLPNIVVVFILVLSIMSLVRNLLAYHKEKSEAPTSHQESKTADKVHLGHLALFLIPCFLMMPAMAWIGFIPAGIGFMLVIQYLCGQRKPVVAVVVSVCSVGIIYAAMRYGLGVPLP